MATVLTSAIVNVNIAKLKRDLEALGDIKVLSISPKAGIVDTNVAMVRGDGISNLTGPQQSSAQAVIDGHVDQQLENILLEGNTEILFKTKVAGKIKINQGGLDTWEFNETSYDLLPLQSNLKIGSLSNPIGFMYADNVKVTTDLVVDGDITVSGSISGGGSVALVDNEIPSGLIDGINTVYTTAFDFASNSIKIFLNGIRLRSGIGNDYTETDTDEFTMNFAPTTGDVLVVDYKKA